MKPGRSHLIWVPGNGSGKIRTFFLSPSLVRVFALLVFFCLCSIPFLETGILELSRKTARLEQKKRHLQAEVVRLQYIKRALAHIEEKEKVLRNYVGLEKYGSLEQIIGGGGKANYNLPLFDRNRVGRGNEPRGRKGSHDMSLPTELHRLASNFEILNQLVLKQKETWEDTPSIMPIALENPRISSGFGWRNNPFTDKKEFHAGIDIVGAKGTRVISPAHATVLKKGYDPRLGHYLVLQHTEEIKTIYGHLLKVTVKEASDVKRGDLLGFVGNTGLSTSYHLHYAVIVNNRAVDPTQYILDTDG